MTLEELVARVLDVPLADLPVPVVFDTGDGLSSIQRYELLGAVVTRYGVTFTPAEVRVIGSLADLRTVLAGKGVQA